MFFRDWYEIIINESLEPAHEIMVLTLYHIGNQRRGSVKPAHSRSLARAFAVRTHEVWK